MSTNQPMIRVFSYAPSPHFNPMIEYWIRSGISVDVTFVASRRPSRNWEVPPLPTTVTFLEGSLQRPPIKRFIRGFRVAWRKNDVTSYWVLGGSYADASFLGVWAAIRLRRMPFLFWGERPNRSTSSVKKRARKAMLRVLLSSAKSVWTPSHEAKEFYKNVTRAPIVLVPYPLPESVSVEDMPYAQWRNTGPLRILIVGSLIPRKRPELALEVAREIARRGFPASITFVGDGPLKCTLEVGAAEMQVRLIGNRSSLEVLRMMAESHVLVHCSREDGWGMVVPEAVCSGMFVVASRWTDSAVELSNISDTVILCSDSVAEYADAIAAIMMVAPDDGLVRVRQAAQAVFQHSSLKTVGETTLSVLHRLMSTS